MPATNEREATRGRAHRMMALSSEMPAQASTDGGLSACKTTERKGFKLSVEARVDTERQS